MPEPSPDWSTVSYVTIDAKRLWIETAADEHAINSRLRYEARESLVSATHDIECANR